MIKNKANFTSEELKEIFGETLCINLPENLKYEGICIDSRQIEKNNIFIALKGSTLDGHEKVNDSFEHGASAAIVDKYWYKEHSEEFSSKSLVVVSNTLIALQKIANWHRRRFSLPVIAIGGSNGKTTTKDMTAHVLSSKYKVLKTFENFNNQLGLPLMLLQLDESYDMAVLEIGTNEPGEIQILSNVLEPTHGLITNIGKEHLEKLIDIDGVEMEETLLFGYLFKNNGFAFINADDKRLIRYESILENKMTFGQSKEFDVFAKLSLSASIRPHMKIHFNESNFNIKLKTRGVTTGLNALCAITVGLHFGLIPEEIKTSIEMFETEVTHGYARMTLEKIAGFNLINDCYNANPDSMKAAICTLEKVRTPGKKYAVLGDMRELGTSAPIEHKKIVSLASEVADEIFLVGDEMLKAKKELKNLKNISSFKNKDELIEKLISLLKAKDCVLVKGSRGMKMEYVIDEIKNHYKRIR